MKQARLFDIASAARSYLEPIWLVWQRDRGNTSVAIPSTNTCGRSSLFLRDVLRERRLNAEWLSGAPGSENQLGYQSEGKWHGHAWVRCDGLIIDITADQFGGAPVIVTPSDDPRYKSAGIDAAYPHAIEARQRAVAEIWPGWLARRD